VVEIKKKGLKKEQREIQIQIINEEIKILNLGCELIVNIWKDFIKSVSFE